MFCWHREQEWFSKTGSLVRVSQGPITAFSVVFYLCYCSRQLDHRRVLTEEQKLPMWWGRCSNSSLPSNDQRHLEDESEASFHVALYELWTVQCVCCRRSDDTRSTVWFSSKNQNISTLRPCRTRVVSASLWHGFKRVLLLWLNQSCWSGLSSSCIDNVEFRRSVWHLVRSVRVASAL